MGFNSAFKGLKLLKKTGKGRLNNLNDPVLNVLKIGPFELMQCSWKRCLTERTGRICNVMRTRYNG